MKLSSGAAVPIGDNQIDHHCFYFRGVMIIIQAILRFLISLLERIQGKVNPNDKEIKELRELIDKVEQEKAKPVEDKDLQGEIDFWKKGE